MRRIITVAAICLSSFGLTTTASADDPDAAEEAERLATSVVDRALSVAETQDGEGEMPRTEAGDALRLALLVTGNIDGHVARVDCRREPDDADLLWAKRVAYHRFMDQLSRSSELLEPIAVTSGNSVFPGVFARYLATHGADRATRLSMMFAEVPMKVHGVGRREFSIPTGALVEFGEAMAERGIDMQAANLVCQSFGGAESVCDVLQTAQDERPFFIYERDDLTVAITTVLGRDLLEPLAAEQRRGMRILDPLVVLDDLVEEMADQADLVIVQHQVSSGSSPQETFRIARSIEGIDLVLASRFFDDRQLSDRNPEFHTTTLGAVSRVSATGTPIVSANSGPEAVIYVDVEVGQREGDEGGKVIRSVTPWYSDLSQIPVDPRAAQMLRDGIDEFCEGWGDPIGEMATLEDSFSMEDFQVFVLNIMRFATDRELALINRRAFRDDQRFPLTDSLTRADVYAALPFENRVALAEVSGEVLAALAQRLVRGDLIGAGIAVVDGEVEVNGRPVDRDRTYRIALNDYLAEGGDEIFDPDVLKNRRIYHPRWSDRIPSLDEVVIEYVASKRHIGTGTIDDAISARHNFPDLHRQFLWTITASLNSSYNQVAVHNPIVDGAPGYEQGQLTVLSTDQVHLESKFVANADSRDHGWDNDLAVQYASSRVHDGEGQAGFEKTKDQIRLRSRYRYQGFRADAQGRWYVPDPMTEGQLETEFSPTPERQWHRLDLRGIAGLSFQLFRPLDARIGLNIHHEVNRPDALPTWGVNAAATLARVNPFDILGRPVRIESEAEYFFNDIARRNIHEIRTSNRVFFAVFESFFFTTTFNAFIYRDDVVGEFGTNTELTIGLNYTWQTTRQQ